MTFIIYFHITHRRHICNFFLVRFNILLCCIRNYLDRIFPFFLFCFTLIITIQFLVVLPRFIHGIHEHLLNLFLLFHVKFCCQSGRFCHRSIINIFFYLFKYMLYQICNFLKYILLFIYIQLRIFHYPVNKVFCPDFIIKHTTDSIVD